MKRRKYMQNLFKLPIKTLHLEALKKSDYKLMYEIISVIFFWSINYHIEVIK